MIENEPFSAAELEYERIESLQTGWVIGTLVVLGVSWLAAWLLPVAFNVWTIAAVTVLSWVVGLGPLESQQDHLREQHEN